MWRKISLVLIVLLASASIALAQATSGSVTFSVNPGASRVWSGSENLGGYGPLRFVFNGGNVTMYDKDGATPGTWDYRNGITMTFYNGEVEYNSAIPTQPCNYVRSFGMSGGFYYFHVGVGCASPTMGGEARNTRDGRTWHWNTSAPAVPVVVNGTYNGAHFGFTIPISGDGTGSGEAVLGAENPDPALLTWRMRLEGADDWVYPAIAPALTSSVRAEAGMYLLTVQNHTHMTAHVRIDEHELGMVERLNSRTFTIPERIARREMVTLSAWTMANNWNMVLTGVHENFHWDLVPNP